MTREEAIEDIRDNIKPVVGGISLDMAIKALEKQPCEDCISREAVEEMIKAEMPERGMWEIEGDKEKETVCEVCVDLMQKLSDLPSVSPKPKTGHWINLENTKYKGQVLPFWGRYECSKCGGHGDGTSNYCPNCGANMRESEDKE